MRSKKREVIIELTSLLDVVMIIIFAVLIENSRMTKASQSDLVDAQTQLEQMQEEIDKLNEELDVAQGIIAEGNTAELLDKLEYAQSVNESYKYLDNVVIVINVNLENRFNNTKRCLTYGRGIEDNNYKSPDIARDDKEQWKLEVNNFRMYLNDTVSSILEEDASKDENDKRRIYITFSADYDKVYSSDYDDVLESIQTLIDRDTTGLVQLHRVSLNEEEE